MPEVRERKRSTAEGITRGLRYLAGDDLEEATAELRSVVEVIPDDPVALDLLAQATLRRRERLLGRETLSPGAG